MKNQAKTKLRKKGRGGRVEDLFEGTPFYLYYFSFTWKHQQVTVENQLPS